MGSTRWRSQGGAIGRYQSAGWPRRSRVKPRASAWVAKRVTSPTWRLEAAPKSKALQCKCDTNGLELLKKRNPPVPNPRFRRRLRPTQFTDRPDAPRGLLGQWPRCILVWMASGARRWERRGERLFSSHRSTWGKTGRKENAKFFFFFKYYFLSCNQTDFSPHGFGKIYPWKSQRGPKPWNFWNILLTNLGFERYSFLTHRHVFLEVWPRN